MKNIILICALIIPILAKAEGETPKPLKQMIERFEGKWEGDAVLTVEGSTFQFPYHTDFKKAADGAGLMADEWFTHKDLGSLKALNVIGYNANDGKIHWFTVDNFGTTHDHLGQWKSDDHFTMEANEKKAGKKYREVISMKFKDKNTVVVELTGTLAGKVTEKLSLTMKRK